jgi:hypothetical protein
MNTNLLLYMIMGRTYRLQNYIMSYFIQKKIPHGASKGVVVEELTMIMALNNASSNCVVC